MSRYFKIRLDDRRVFVRIKNGTKPVMFGTRVTREGDEYERVNAVGVTQEVVGFTPDNIVAEYVMSNHYATLVPIK